jgi:peptidoglycan/xylan/chitin deacetylase (PgdA/CDA1 family)
MERTLDGVLDRSPAQGYFRWRVSHGLVVLAYHDVPDADAFAWQVDYLREHMHPVALADVTAAMRARSTLPRGAVLITFDDGDRTVYENALPVLRARRVPAATFVVAGLIGTREPFWWREVDQLTRAGAAAPDLPPDASARVAALKAVSDSERRAALDRLRSSAPHARPTEHQLERSELRELDAAGISIGNHTLTHPCLDRCSDAILEAEIVQAHEKLLGILGKGPTAFAYPNGNADGRALRILARLRYDVAFLFDHRVGRFPPSNPYGVSRVRISSRTSPDRFRILTSGLHSAVHHLIGRR